MGIKKQMPYGDGIPKINCYSLTDINDFEKCPLLFYVKHHLGRKEDIDESSPQIALGHILDQTIKNFHKQELYGCRSSQKIKRLVRSSVDGIRQKVAYSQYKGKHDFYEASLPYMTEEVIIQSEELFLTYYVTRKGKIKNSLGEVGFCEYVIPAEGDPSGQIFKLWGGPDCLEMGDDGMPEIADYKSRKNFEKKGVDFDMDLMPKMYVLLCSKRLLNLGYKTARFVVRVWQDPLNEDIYEEFNVEEMSGAEFLFKQKIQKIIGVSEFQPCGKRFCAACKSDKKDQFLKELEKKGFKLMSGEEFLEEQGSNLPF